MPAAKKVAAAPTKKAAPAKAVKAATPEKKVNAAFMKAMTPSKELAKIVGEKPLPRTEVTKAVWDYIKKHGLQDSANRRQINADPALKAVFGKSSVTMFEMTKLVNAHLS